MDMEKITRFDQLSGEQRELAETIGLESYRKLVEQYGGNPLYIPKSKTVLKEIIRKEISKNFDGKNYRKLSIKYGLSEKTIRKILSEK